MALHASRESRLILYIVSVFGPEGVLDQRVKCCVSLSWMVMQGEHTEVYPGSGKRRPYVQRGERGLYFLAPRCLRRGYKLAREGVEPKSQRRKERVQDDCLRC
jgi:hypothetical protein